MVTAAEDGLLRRFPLKPTQMVDDLCNYISRNMSDIEWRQYVGDVNEIPWVETCVGKIKPSDEASNSKIQVNSSSIKEKKLESNGVSNTENK